MAASSSAAPSEKYRLLMMRQASACLCGAKGTRVMFGLLASLEVRVSRARRMGGWGLTMRSSRRTPMRRGLVVVGWWVVSVDRLYYGKRFGAHCLLVNFSPRYRYERGFV